MAKRKQTRDPFEQSDDVMSSLLDEKATESPKPETISASKPPTVQASEPLDVETSDRPTAKTSKYQNVQIGSQELREYILDDDKVRATIYLSQDTNDQLETAQLRLKQLIAKTIADGKDKRMLVTKSLLTELALKYVLQEYEDQGTNSYLAKQMSGL